MYTIKATNDGTEYLIYSPYQTDEGYAILSGSFDEEINKAANLTFTLLKNHPNRNQLHKLKTLIYLYEDGTLLFRGRIVELTQAFDTSVEYVCESDLAFLNDTDLYTTIGGGVSWSAQQLYEFLISMYNSVMTRHNGTTEFNDRLFEESGYRFTAIPSTTTVRVEEFIDFRAMDGFFDLFINPFGGWLKVRHASGKNYLDWVALPSLEGDPTNSQLIEFGKNIVDFSEHIDASQVVTAVYPFGGQYGTISIASVNQGKTYLEDTGASTAYGARYARRIVYTELTEPEEIKTAGERDLAKLKLSPITMDISAIDLSMIHVDYSKLKLGQTNRVLSLPHGVDGNFLLQRVEIDLADPSKNRYIFGRSMKKLTDTMEYNRVITRG